jgi:hypothetical protein
MSVLNSLFLDVMAVLNYLKGVSAATLLGYWASFKVLVAAWKAKLAADAELVEAEAKAEAAKIEIDIKGYWSYLWTEIKAIF